VQRSWQTERRRVGDVEDLEADLELALLLDAQLAREPEIQLPQRRTGHLSARTAERAEVGLSDSRDRRRILERRRSVDLVDVVLARVRIADDQRVAAGPRAAGDGAVDRLRLAAVERQNTDRAPGTEPCA